MLLESVAPSWVTSRAHDSCAQHLRVQGDGFCLGVPLCGQLPQRLDQALCKVRIGGCRQPNLGELRCQERSDISHLSAPCAEPSSPNPWSLESPNSPEEALPPPETS